MSDPIRFVEKVWGREEIIVNTSLYAGKILHLDKGARCSIHWHEQKRETFYCMSGKVQIEIEDEGPRIILPGDKVDVPRYTKHRFTGIEDSKLIEFSTHDDPNDSFRITVSERCR